MTEQENITSNTEEFVNETLEEEIDVDEDVSEWDLTQEDEEKLALAQKVKELEEKNQKLYEKMKSWYKKWTNLKQKISTDYVSKDEVRNIMEQVQKEKEDELRLVDTFEDAKELLTEVKKFAKDKWLSIEDSYAFVKGKMLADDGYRNQILESRVGNHGSFVKNDLKSKADNIFSKWPRISMIGKQD
jgi:deoxyribodipyrimidine photolyase